MTTQQSAFTSRDFVWWDEVVIWRPDTVAVRISSNASFAKALNAAFDSRGIKSNQPSEALDACRDQCIDEAALATCIVNKKFAWRIVPGESWDTLYVACDGYSLDSLIAYNAPFQTNNYDHGEI